MAKTTKLKLIENAGNLFLKQGYEGTSINDVVNKAGVSKGAFFHYYSNKQAILKEVIDKYAREQLIESLEKHMSATSSVKESLFNWIEEIFTNFKNKGFKGGCLVGNMALELSEQDDIIRENIKGHFLDLENALVLHLKPLNTEGKLFIEARQFARLLIASIQGITMMSKVHKDSNRASREFMALAQLIEHVIKDRAA
ncbi:MAG: TetR/AcrR family transcriptional regulator [Alphaproteobacteria bacterium]|nr:TetR/AcrR family transcriptional regulator [Alphaproteobacteria bacterium]